MGVIHVCFNFNPSSDAASEDYFYSSCYKPLVKFLYAHPSFKFAFSFFGPQFSYYNKKKKEFISVLKDFISSKQIEVIGSGYYNPILPLLSSTDRNSQIDKFITESRQILGKRSRGIFLNNDIWDSSLVNNLHTCGIDFVTLDNSLFPDHIKTFLPVVMSDLGKCVKIYPSYKISDFCSCGEQKELKAGDFVSALKSKVAFAEKKDDYYQFSPDRIILITLNVSELSSLLASNFFESFESFINENNCDITTTFPSLYDKSDSDRVLIPYYLSSGVNKNVSEWTLSNQSSKNQKPSLNVNIYDVLNALPAARILASRLLYENNFINIYKGDKIKKKIAREKLYQAQNGRYLLCPKDSMKDFFALRQQSYKIMGEIEVLLHEDSKIPQSITSFDYDGDGLLEYVCRMSGFYAFISKLGGSVGELQVYKPGINYCDCYSRKACYDGFDDKYRRGLFIDHFLSEQDFSSYLENAVTSDGVFSKIRYTESFFSQSKFEVHLKAEAVLPQSKQKISLLKKIIINSDGMYVQYYIKNESETTLKAKFAVESTFCNSAFDNFFDIEVASTAKISGFTSRSKKNVSEASAVRLSDMKNGVSFVFEPNEKCGCFIYPLTYKFPDLGDSLVEIQKSTVHTLYWNINLEPHSVTEKNFNFTIIPVKKNKKK